MRRNKMFGLVDPITLGILIALGGTALGLTQTGTADKPAAVAASEAKVASPAPAAAVQAERTVR
jgi:hypothetical protein